MYKIVVDSGSDYNKDVMKESEIEIEFVPLNLQLEDKVYIDDENLDIDDYLVKMDQCPTVAKTAAPSPELFLDSFKGKESVFAVTLSSHLSGSYNSAMAAKQMYLEEFSHKFIHVFDSMSASVGEFLVALKIHECDKKNQSEAEVVETVSQFVTNMKTYFILEKYDTLVKNGRMNPYVAKIASMLSIKPICAGIEGKIAFVDKARGYSKAVGKLVDIMVKDKVDFENRILGITHVKCLEKAEQFRDEVMKRIPFKDVIIMESRGLVATYANRNGIVICF